MRKLAALVLMTVGVFNAAAEERFRGPGGEPLPFDDDLQILDFLASAEVVSSEVVPGGTSRTLKVLLEKDGVRAHAAFRTIDLQVKKAVLGGRVIFNFHDSHAYEVAAYELSRLLGMSNVPPVVPREVDGEAGSLQLWIEGAMTDDDREDRGLERPEGWYDQLQTMWLFDRLIDNFDRNSGNMLLDGEGKYWMIDHTRSFRLTADVTGLGSVTRCERGFLAKLQDLDRAEVEARLAPYLSKGQVRFLWKRRKKVLDHVHGLVDRFGEDAVFQ